MDQYTLLKFLHWIMKLIILNKKIYHQCLFLKLNFPKIVYMIVDKKIELEIKYLKDFPDWQFLSKR